MSYLRIHYACLWRQLGQFKLCDVWKRVLVSLKKAKRVTGSKNFNCAQFHSVTGIISYAKVIAQFENEFIWRNVLFSYVSYGIKTIFQSVSTQYVHFADYIIKASRVCQL